MDKEKHLIQIYLLGFEHASDDVYDFDNYFSNVEDKAYELGKSHFLQGKSSFSAEEIIKQIKND